MSILKRQNLQSGETSFDADRLIDDDETEINLFDNLQPKIKYTFEDWKKSMEAK